jgi:hypothetical protein
MFIMLEMNSGRRSLVTAEAVCGQFASSGNGSFSSLNEGQRVWSGK